MSTIGFIRVSKLDQDTEKNKLDMLQFAHRMQLGNIQFVEEKVSGTKDYRKRRLGTLLEELDVGDVLVVPELSRIARSTIQILEVIQLTQDKGIKLYSLKENFCNMDNSIASTVTKTIFALVAQIERELISLRTKEALHAKKEAGIHLGRPKGKGKSKLDDHKEDILKMLSYGVPKTMIAKQYGTSVGNLYNFLSHIQ